MEPIKALDGWYPRPWRVSEFNPDEILADNNDVVDLNDPDIRDDILAIVNADYDAAGVVAGALVDAMKGLAHELEAFAVELRGLPGVDSVTVQHSASNTVDPIPGMVYVDIELANGKALTWWAEARRDAYHVWLERDITLNDREQTVLKTYDTIDGISKYTVSDAIRRCLLVAIDLKGIVTDLTEV